MVRPNAVAVAGLRAVLRVVMGERCSDVELEALEAEGRVSLSSGLISDGA
jgi:hypothetical protein